MGLLALFYSNIPSSTQFEIHFFSSALNAFGFGASTATSFGLGGISFATHGDYTWMWYADIALALLAALVNMPIREAPMRKTAPKIVPA